MNLRHLINCVICREISRSNIGFCPNEHHTCPKCFLMLPQVRGRRQCQYCQVEFEALKQLKFVNDNISKIPFPCHNELFGCPAMLLLKDIGNHEVDCQYRVIQCPLKRSDCAWEGAADEAIAHLFNAHGKVYFFKGHKKFCVNLRLSKTVFDWYLVFSFDDHAILMHAFLDVTNFYLRFQTHLTAAKSAEKPSVRIRFESFSTPAQWMVLTGIVDHIHESSFSKSFPMPVEYIIDNYIRDEHIVFKIIFH